MNVLVNKTLSILLILLFIIPGSLAANSSKSAYKLFKNREYDKAHNFLSLAKKGDAKAQQKLGYLYSKGEDF